MNEETVVEEQPVEREFKCERFNDTLCSTLCHYMVFTQKANKEGPYTLTCTKYNQQLHLGIFPFGKTCLMCMVDNPTEKEQLECLSK